MLILLFQAKRVEAFKRAEKYAKEYRTQELDQLRYSYLLKRYINGQDCLIKFYMTS